MWIVVAYGVGIMREEIMVVKTLEDCIKCEVVLICDAHNINGGWRHKQGVSPCDVGERLLHARKSPTT